MQWLLLCASALSLPLLAFHPMGKPCTEEPPPFDADLFRRDAQVFSVHAEFLFWTVNEGALDYALKMKHPAWGPSPSYAQGTMESGTYDSDPGFRIAFSFFRAPRYWEVRSSYTRLTCSGNNDASKPGATTEFLTGTWPQIIPSPLTGASSHLHMNYNLYDLTIARFYNPNPHLRLRLIAGFMVPWMDQEWTVQYGNAAQFNTTLTNRWRFVGGGIKAA